MTRKDFELIAAVFAGTFAHLRAAAAGAGVSREADRATVLNAMRMADALATDNPRFDRARFLRACGVEA